MQSIFWSSVISLLALSTLQAQTRTVAERLGHPAGSKLLILHADDLGVAHSEDAASFDALDKGAINSASIMIPTPWVTEVAEYAKAHPNADLGLHLTLTSEWATYRWGSVAPRDSVPSLLDADGTFPRDTKTVATRAKLDEVERELRAQVERALALGIRPTHLDSHMGALFNTPGLMATYIKVARAYRLPFLRFIGAPASTPHSALTPQDVVLDAVIIAGPEVPREKWAQFYLDAVAGLKPGLSEIIVHLGHDDAELQAVMVGHDAYGSAWRKRDYDVLNSAEFKKALEDNHIVLVKWRDVQRLMYPQP
ncbi:MAG: YdjC family protein [Gemmatimonadetes bacterium]|nr:YdjC family protein [Gemmatimonadota bacterium]